MLSTFTLQMFRRIGVRKFQTIRLGHQYTNMWIRPIVCGQILQEQHQTLRIQTRKKTFYRRLICTGRLYYFAPGNLSLATVVRANGAERRHKRTVERRQSHRIRLDMCPIIGSCNVNSVLWSIGCSSSGMKIEDSRHRAFAVACVVCLEDIGNVEPYKLGSMDEWHQVRFSVAKKFKTARQTNSTMGQMHCRPPFTTPKCGVCHTFDPFWIVSVSPFSRHTWPRAQ